MRPVLTAYAWVPPVAQGLVRDLRVRWALEETNVSYDVELISLMDRPADYMTWQPFGQVPAYQDQEGTIFESAAIVLHIAEQQGGLLPREGPLRSRVIAWMFAALNTVELPISLLQQIGQAGAGGESLIGPTEGAIASRLASLARALGSESYLVERFSAADLLMTTVLRALRDTTLVEQHPSLVDYQHRCQSRPAFQKALNAQLSTFQKHEP